MLFCYPDFDFSSYVLPRDPQYQPSKHLNYQKLLYIARLPPRLSMKHGHCSTYLGHLHNSLQQLLLGSHMAGHKEAAAAAVLLDLAVVALHQVAAVVAVAGVHLVRLHLADQSAI
jgi:hypothetical protein